MMNGSMKRRSVFFLLPLLLSLLSCKPAEENHLKAILGAVLIDGLGGPPLTDSIVVTGGERIRAVGARSAVPVPADADKINGGGRFLMPATLDVCNTVEPAGMIHPVTAEQARTQVADAASRKVGAIHIGKLAPGLAEAVMESARDAGIPVIGHISTEAEVRLLVNGGAAGFVGMIRDTEDLDPALVANLRNLKTFFAPALSSGGAAPDVAKRNAAHLFHAGVPIAVATLGGDYQRELELLVDTGIPPLDVIVAATRNTATALHQQDTLGTIEPGKRANLLLLSANPGEDIHNLRKVALRMVDGSWVR
jgi:imidazolonepropionase-like amidohydrolase